MDAETTDGASEVSKPGRRGAAGWATFFGVLAIALAAAAVFVAVRQATQPQLPTPPPAPPGHNELINVINALRGEGFEVSSVPGGLPVGEMRVPGQQLTVDGQTLYVFLYPTPAEAAADLDMTDPAAVLGENGGEPPFLTGQSNVVVALVDGSEEQRERVARAIGGLP
jgi:hypothetical protein